MKRIFCVALAAACLSGCVQRVGDFTLASTKNMDISNDLHHVDTTKRARGRDVAHIVFFIPTGIPNMKEAMDNTIETSPGAVGLSNVTIKRGGFWIPFIYGQDYFEVEGNPVFENKKSSR